MIAQDSKFSDTKNLGKTQGVTPTEMPNAGGIAENCRLLTRSVVNLVRSQFCHTERPPYLSAARLQ